MHLPAVVMPVASGGRAAWWLPAPIWQSAPCVQMQSSQSRPQPPHTPSQTALPEFQHLHPVSLQTADTLATPAVSTMTAANTIPNVFRLIEMTPFSSGLFSAFPPHMHYSSTLQQPPHQRNSSSPSWSRSGRSPVRNARARPTNFPLLPRQRLGQLPVAPDKAPCLQKMLRLEGKYS